MVCTFCMTTVLLFRILFFRDQRVVKEYSTHNRLVSVQNNFCMRSKYVNKPFLKQMRAVIFLSKSIALSQDCEFSKHQNQNFPLFLVIHLAIFNYIWCLSFTFKICPKNGLKSPKSIMALQLAEGPNLLFYGDPPPPLLSCLHPFFKFYPIPPPALFVALFHIYCYFA